MEVAFGEADARADPELLAVTDAEGEVLFSAVALAERDAVPVSLAVAHGEDVLDAVELSGVAVSLPLRLVDGDGEDEEEFRAVTEDAAEDE